MSDMSDRGESPLFTILVPALVVIVFSIIVGTVAMSFSHQRLTTAILPQNAAYASTVGEDSDEPAQTPAKEKDFGHVSCPAMTVEELASAGGVQVGNAIYKGVDSSAPGFADAVSNFELVSTDGVYQDRFGYIACLSGANEIREIIDTPLGPGKVYGNVDDPTLIGIMLDS